MNICEDGLSQFISARPRLFGIAYRMLGSAAEAEDILQDVWLRWQAADRNAVLDPPAFLATITTRLAINLAQSARLRRESYVGTWLPEPVDTANDPCLGAERGEAVEFAVLLLLETLSPTERAAYILREAFDYPLPPDCRSSSAGRSPYTATGNPGAAACEQRTPGKGERCRTAAASGCVYRRRAKRRPRRAGTVVLRKTWPLRRTAAALFARRERRFPAVSAWRSLLRLSPATSGPG